MNNPKQLNPKGQILVIMLIALAILSIFVVVVATNARRDTVSRVQEEQYEQYYSAAEEKLLRILEGEEDWATLCIDDNNQSPDNCTHTFDPNSLEDDTLSSSAQAKVTVTSVEGSSITGYNLEQDRTLKLNLLKSDNTSYTGDVNISWQGNVSWMISFDYKNAAGEYMVYKAIHDPAELFSNEKSTPCISVNGDNAISIIKFDAFCTTNIIALRIKPLGGSASELVVTGDADFPAQIRTLTAETTIVDPGSINEAPRPVLIIQQPLHSAPIELFDYVLRTESGVNK